MGSKKKIGVGWKMVSEGNYEEVGNFWILLSNAVNFVRCRRNSCIFTSLQKRFCKE